MNKAYYTRRGFLKLMGLGAASIAAGSDFFKLVASQPPKLNVIVILVDDLGYSDLACYGSRFYETPHIDNLARAGMKFTNGYAACAVCSPTRAALLTGRYPARLGLTDWLRWGKEAKAATKNPEGYTAMYQGRAQKLLCPENPFSMEHSEVTIAEVLGQHGYTCCHVGKWHLGLEKWFPQTQGFHFNIGGCAFGAPPSYFDPYSGYTQFSQHAARNIPTITPRKKGEYLVDREADEACKFIENHKDKPFFLYWASYAVHQPIQGKGELIEKYQQKRPTKQNNPIYAAMVESVDIGVGKIRTTLEKNNLTDNTVIIFTSDNGGLMIPTCSFNGLPGPTNNAPLREGKTYPYEGGIRVPFIFYGPGVVKPDSLCHIPVTSVDIFPTICALTGCNLPPDTIIDGENLLPLLRQSGNLQREAIYWHYPHYISWGPGLTTTPNSIIRCGDWKLIKRYEDETFELFNLSQDIAEKNNLADQMPDKVEYLNKKLTNWLKETGAKLPKPNPNYTADN